MKDDQRKTQPMKLGNDTLPQLATQFDTPNYDRRTLTPGIVHIGLGNFHRAHQAWYLHRLMQMGRAHDWAIVGAGVRAGDAAMRDRLLAQDCLTTLIELSAEGRAVEITGAMIDFLPVEETNASLIAQMSDASTRIVSLTVTEGGYYVDAATGGFDAGHPDIVHDAENPATPRTAFGAMIAALANRRASGLGPFTAMCCDNLQGNGDVLRQTVVSLAKMSDPDLAAWIEAEVAFPNSMVDCIVPATGSSELELVQELGIEDAAPVTHENYRQWVIEDNFCAGRPEWEAVGATLTDDVHAYEAMKIRILNGGHQVLANVAELLSIETITDAIVDPDIQAYFRKVQTQEILPYVAAVPGITPPDYLTLIERRFSNPSIRDTTRRVAFDGSSRHVGFILPVVRDALERGGSITGLALVEALWAHMCAGVRVDGSTIEPNDPHWDSLSEAARRSIADPSAWLAQTQIYGTLSASAEFAAQFAFWHANISENGVRLTLRQYCNLSS